MCYNDYPDAEGQHVRSQRFQLCRWGYVRLGKETAIRQTIYPLVCVIVPWLIYIAYIALSYFMGQHTKHDTGTHGVN